jgi:hypothetical protein
MTKFKIDYFSSEMGAGELKKRLLNFQPTIGPTDWTFNAWECNSNFANAIKPGAGNLNVIDFLEIHKDFWEVGGFLADIHSRLKGAIAVVALQKNPGSEFGLGGGRGLEKPRLYLSMSRDGVCKIVKAKNWRTSENPNGLQLNYKLVQGCHFYVYRDWYREERK